jgi:PAS domain S-box-containing protein
MNKRFELFDFIYDGICIINSEYKILFWNSSIETYTGINREDILNHSLTDNFPSFNHPKYRLRIDLLFAEGTPVLISTQLNETIFIRKKRESKVFQEITISRIPAGKEGKNYALLNVKDITDLSNRINDFRMEHSLLVQEIKQRELLETKLRESLGEKEILIKEVHHRVKNNLMLISGLIKMQKWKIDNEETISILNDLEKR